MHLDVHLKNLNGELYLIRMLFSAFRTGPVWLTLQWVPGEILRILLSGT